MQRYAIYLGRQAKRTQKQIADEIGVSQSTVSRELRRGSRGLGGYNWMTAQERAEARKSRSPGNRSLDPLIVWEALELLETRQWSPEQISGHMALQGKNISHETIYKRIRENPDRYAKHCHHQMRYRKKRRAERRPTKATNIPNRVSIHQRPPEVNGKRFGDWEIDLVVDSRQRALLTLTEMSTNLMLIEKLEHGKKAMNVAKAVCRLLFPFREHVLSITTDNGSEFAAHQYITHKLKAQVYFTDAYSSWQKGCIENTNKLIRKYIPKKANFARYTDEGIRKIKCKLNNRPREKLNFDSPLFCFSKYFY